MGLTIMANNLFYILGIKQQPMTLFPQIYLCDKGYYYTVLCEYSKKKKVKHRNTHLACPGPSTEAEKPRGCFVRNP